jgi:hypothetical protein
MALAKITRTGLSAIAMLVTILWACILSEHLIVRRANEELSRAMWQMRELRTKRGAEPASIPAQQPRFIRPVVG